MLLDSIKGHSKITTGLDLPSNSQGNVVFGESKPAELQNKITFYSLYLHLLAYDDYQGLDKPKYWQEKNNTADEAKDKIVEPEKYDDVVSSKSIDIKAGDLIG